MSKFNITLLVSLIILLSGCASNHPAHTRLQVKALPEIDASDNSKAWWRIQFIKQWPDGSNAPFNYDVLLAEQVIRPVLKQHHEKIALWRFHRRAVRDAAGSKFSFIFFSNPEDAQTITESITSNQLLQKMIDHKLVEKLWIDDFSTPQRPGINDSSDKAWPIEIQNSWPYFIMGVSQSWLALIHEFSSRKPIDARTLPLEKIIKYYTEISDQIDTYWGENGQHAYIHHLSALFAYRPIHIRF